MLVGGDVQGGDLSYTIHFFTIQEERFEVRHEMKIGEKASEEHSFTVYKNDQPFENHRFSQKIELGPMDDTEDNSNLPNTLNQIPTGLEERVRAFLHLDN